MGGAKTAIIMNLKTLSTLLFVACLAAFAHAQMHVPALTSLASRMTSFQEASQTVLYSSASSAYSRISSEVQRAHSKQSETAQSSASNTAQSSETGAAQSSEAGGAQSSDNGNNGATATATAQGQDNQHSGASAFEMSNIMLFQGAAWAFLFIASFAAMFA